MTLVPQSGLLPLGSVNVTHGTAITFAGPNTITLAPNQTYQASYSSIVMASGSAAAASIGLDLNGAGIAGSGSSALGLTAGQQTNLQNSVIFDVPAGGTGLLTLQNFGQGTTFYNTQVSVVKLA